MQFAHHIRLAVLIVAAASATTLHAKTIFFGPTPYLSAADSPFDLSGLGTTFWLEDFEDGALNTRGVTSDPSAFDIPYFDSVDSDDGTIDGHGDEGRALRVTGIACGTVCLGSFIAEFDRDVLGDFPKIAGLVWTRGFPGLPPTVPQERVTFAAYGSSHELLGVITANGLGDSSNPGSTAEDRFFGAASTNGISRIEISSLGVGEFKIDHLQYGLTVPEPSSDSLVGFACLIATTVCLCQWFYLY